LSFEAAFEDFKRRFLPLKGVVGVSRGARRIIVYVESREVASSIPREWQGFPVEVVVVGRIAPV